MSSQQLFGVHGDTSSVFFTNSVKEPPWWKSSKKRLKKKDKQDWSLCTIFVDHWSLSEQGSIWIHPLKSNIPCLFDMLSCNQTRYSIFLNILQQWGKCTGSDVRIVPSETFKPSELCSSFHGSEYQKLCNKLDSYITCLLLTSFKMKALLTYLNDLDPNE